MENLPLDILHSIAATIDDADLNHLRQTSKQLASAVAAEFDRRHFFERNHTLTPFGLEELVKITNEPALCNLLKVITFNLSTESDHDYINEERFVQTIRRIFDNVTRHQNAHGITVAFTDNVPTQTRAQCTEAMWRIAERPSYGWYALFPPRTTTRTFFSFRNVRRLGLVTLGAAMQRILPLAIKSGCQISALELRMVGRLHLTQLQLSLHGPNVRETLSKIQLPPTWDIKLYVVVRDCEIISSIQFASADQHLKIERILLGDLDPANPDCYIYDLACGLSVNRLKSMELINCSADDMQQLDEQFDELTAGGNLQSLTIRGLRILDNSGWGQLFRSISKIETLERCVIEGLRLAPEQEIEDEEDEVETEEDEDNSSNSGDEHDGESGGEEAGDGNTEVNKKEEAKKKLEMLGCMLADVHISLIKRCGDDIPAEMVKTSDKVPDIA